MSFSGCWYAEGELTYPWSSCGCGHMWVYTYVIRNDKEVELYLKNRNRALTYKGRYTHVATELVEFWDACLATYIMYTCAYMYMCT